MHYEEKTFEKNGLKLNYITIGEGSPLVFLHGGGLNVFTYSKTLSLLSQKHHVIAPNLSYFKNPTKIFSEFVDSLDLENILLVGHSLGGGIALKLASENKNISRLILVDSTGISPDYHPSQFIYLLLLKTFRGLFLFENKLISFTMIRDFLKEISRNIFSLRRLYKTVLNLIYDEHQTFEKIQIPTFLFWGNSDELFSKECAKKMNQKISGSKLEFVEGNHDWMLLMPEKFCEMISKTRD